MNTGVTSFDGTSNKRYASTKKRRHVRQDAVSTAFSYMKSSENNSRGELDSDRLHGTTSVK